ATRAPTLPGPEPCTDSDESRDPCADTAGTATGTATGGGDGDGDGDGLFGFRFGQPSVNFSPRYTCRARPDDASCDGVPSSRIFPSAMRYARSQIESVSRTL